MAKGQAISEAHAFHFLWTFLFPGSLYDIKSQISCYLLFREEIFPYLVLNSVGKPQDETLWGRRGGQASRRKSALSGGGEAGYVVDWLMHSFGVLYSLILSRVHQRHSLYCYTSLVFCESSVIIIIRLGMLCTPENALTRMHQPVGT